MGARALSPENWVSLGGDDSMHGRAYCIGKFQHRLVGRPIDNDISSDLLMSGCVGLLP